MKETINKGKELIKQFKGKLVSTEIYKELSLIRFEYQTKDAGICGFSLKYHE